MITTTSVVEHLCKPPFAADALETKLDGLTMLRLPLERLFSEVSDHLLIVFPPDDPATPPGGRDGSFNLAELERYVGRKRITLLVGDPRKLKPPGGGINWIVVDRDALSAATSRRSVEPLRDLLLERVPPALLSPYQSDRAVVPSMFFGRQEEVDDLCEAKQSYVLFGARRIGKSSLAQRVARELKAFDTYRYSYGKGPREVEWYSVAYVELHRLASIDDIWRELLLRMGFSMKDLMPGAKFRVSLTEKRQAIPLTEYEIINRILTKKSSRALFLLDEVDRLLRLDRKAGYPFFTQLQSLIDDPACNLRVVLFGYEELLRAWHSGDFPLNHGRLQKKIVLGPLTSGEVGQLLEKPMQRVGVKIENLAQARETVHAATGGMPNLVQDLCQCLLGLDTVALARTVTLKDISTAVKSTAFLQRIDLQFGQITEALPRLIAFLMADREEFRLETVLEAVLRSRLPVNDKHIEVALDQLELYGILEVAGQAREYVFASQVMRDRLRSQALESRLKLLKQDIVGEYRGRPS